MAKASLAESLSNVDDELERVDVKKRGGRKIRQMSIRARLALSRRALRAMFRPEEMRGYSDAGGVNREALE
jgi:hypothetical protein